MENKLLLISFLPVTVSMVYADYCDCMYSQLSSVITYYSGWPWSLHINYNYIHVYTCTCTLYIHEDTNVGGDMSTYS